MQTKTRLNKQTLPASKTETVKLTKSQPHRDAPQPLDEKALRHVGGGGGFILTPNRTW